MTKLGFGFAVRRSINLTPSQGIVTLQPQMKTTLIAVIDFSIRCIICVYYSLTNPLKVVIRNLRGSEGG